MKPVALYVQTPDLTIWLNGTQIYRYATNREYYHDKNNSIIGTYEIK